MSVTILEVLENADYNFNNNMPFAFSLAKNQLHNAIALLNKGKKLNDTFNEEDLDDVK